MHDTNPDNTIKPGAAICFHFTLKLAASQEIIDQTHPETPARCTLGDGKLLPGFEQAMLGLKAGDQTALTITPEQGFGQPNPNNLQTFAKDQFKQQDELREGLILAFADANQNETPGMVKEITEHSVIIDFNHPLAGKTLIFDVNILSVD